LLGEDRSVAERFNDLARAIRQLNHPNIAAVRKVGEEAGLPYIITRAIEKSHPLATRMDQPWAVDMAADLATQVGRALEHGLNKGVLHGNLTPDSIMIDRDGRVTVTDFGLNELMELVGAGVRQAASPYLSAERATGQAATPQSDVYSLAAILYSLLSKRSPQVVKGEILPPSRFNPDVPPAMDEVIVKALAPEPGSRYPDVKTFLAALGAIVLVSPKEKARANVPEGECPRCGADNQTGRFCRKCGYRMGQPQTPARTQPPLAESKLDEPIQVTKVEVGRVRVGEGVQVQETVIARPLKVADIELEVEFPEPLEMPTLGAQGLWPSLEEGQTTAMPEPPEMPVIDWAEIAPPMPEVPSIEETRLDEEQG
jgi:serine/threonine-protein kinase